MGVESVPMSAAHRVRCFDYVNHSYARVRDAMQTGAVEVFQAATRAANTRAESVASELRVQLGGLDVSAEIAIKVEEIREDPAELDSAPVTRLRVEWAAARKPRLFPIMKGVLSVYALTATETQLDFEGEYEPPLGAIGGAVDKLVGHRVAEASVHRFVGNVAEYLRGALTD